jgi:hypothetical protein
MTYGCPFTKAKTLSGPFWMHVANGREMSNNFRSKGITDAPQEIDGNKMIKVRR